MKFSRQLSNETHTRHWWKEYANWNYHTFLDVLGLNGFSNISILLRIFWDTLYRRNKKLCWQFLFWVIIVVLRRSMFGSSVIVPRSQNFRYVKKYYLIGQFSNKLGVFDSQSSNLQYSRIFSSIINILVLLNLPKNLGAGHDHGRTKHDLSFSIKKKAEERTRKS